MTYLLLVLFGLGLLIGCIWSSLDYRRYFSAPTLFWIINIFWTMPQAVALAIDPDIPAFGFAILLIFMIASLGAVYLGWSIGLRKAPAKLTAEFDEARLVVGALLLTIIGQYFSFKLRGLPPELLEMRQPSGLITIFLFFSKVSIIAFALSINLIVRKFSLMRLVLIAINFLFIAELIFITGKRHVLAETFLLIFITLFFVRQWRPRLPILAVPVTLLFLFAASIGEYRHARGDSRFLGSSFSVQETFERVARIPFLENAQAAVVSADPVELKNALFVMLAAHEQMKFSFGLDYWNAIVAAFVPGQLVGSSVKSALFVEVNPINLMRYGHTIRAGSTITGFADGFRSFWLFGLLVFFAFSYFLSRLFSTAIAGNFPAQVIYASLSTDFLLSVTHRSSIFVTSSITLFIFTFVIFYFSKETVTVASQFSCSEPKHDAQGVSVRSQSASKAVSTVRPLFEKK